MTEQEMKLAFERYAAGGRDDRQQVAVQLLAGIWDTPETDSIHSGIDTAVNCRLQMTQAMDAHLIGLHLIEALCERHAPPTRPVRMSRLYCLLQAAYDEFREMQIDLDHKIALEGAATMSPQQPMADAPATKEEAQSPEPGTCAFTIDWQENLENLSLAKGNAERAEVLVGMLGAIRGHSESMGETDSLPLTEKARRVAEALRLVDTADSILRFRSLGNGTPEISGARSIATVQCAVGELRDLLSEMEADLTTERVAKISAG